MRPVERGAWPTDAHGPIQFAIYQEARPYLITGIGDHCSYCEMQLDSGLAVEHIISQHQDGTLELHWENFLLSCVNCNSTKKTKTIALDDFYWPHRDNTFRALTYRQGGVVEPRPATGSPEHVRARRTIELVGLHKRPLANPTQSDRRWLKRREAWDKATLWKAKYLANPTPDNLDAIAELATRGYWSVWMTVFNGMPVVIQRLLQSVPGTVAACFDHNGDPVPRPGGQY